jgi:hypothetical protein
MSCVQPGHFEHRRATISETFASSIHISQGFSENIAHSQVIVKSHALMHSSSSLYIQGRTLKF